MEAGQVIAGRFVIDSLIGAGGMGRVYRAIDQLTDEQIALKVLNLDAKKYSRRFNREAQLLAELDHPAIVRYISSGITETEAPFIAMEWIDGEDLRSRMNRQLLSCDEALRLARRVAAALAAAHELGVVHRDLKPSNLMLVHRDIEQTKLLDFGIARWRGPMVEKMTRTGISIGTPGYMAPEQARGMSHVDGRADIYTLGCVLYESLVGRRPFSGDVQAILAKTVLEEPPRISDARDDISAELDDLVAAMLAAAPDDRPSDGIALIDAIDRIDSATRPEGSEVVAAPGLTRGERHLLCVILVGDTRGAEEPVSETVDIGSSQGTSTPPYRKRPGDGTRQGDLGRLATEHGGRLDRLANGSVVVTFAGNQAATDLVDQAARCALGLRAVRPRAPIVLVTGRAEVTTRHTMGEAIDRAAELLRDVTRDEALAASVSERSVRIDDTTAGLLGARFDVSGGATGLDLRGEHLEPATRHLLGRPTRCVGRQRELAYLTRMFTNCVETRVPRATLIEAPAGVGKSRLRLELERSVRAEFPRANIWLGRGDPVTRGSAFDILGQLVRSAAGIVQEEPLSVRQQKLRARVSRHVAPSEVDRVAEFLGEMSGTPYSAGVDRVQLRAARQSAVLMGDQIRRAWEDFLASESEGQPVLLVLEDLHWGDLPTVRLIDGALRNVTGGAWMLLAIARPEIHDVFPDLWDQRAVEIIRLTGLSEHAGAELIRDALGDRIDDDTVDRLVRLADGNAFYLEELIRAVADDRVDEVPGSILAMAQARLGELDSDARRMLRAAAVFGRIFWASGVAALVGRSQDSDEVAALLRQLEEQEFITPTASTIFPFETEYHFRHELVREAAYSTLTERDRVLGHRLAGDWLELVGSRDALALATHFELGDEPGRATAWYQRSAEQALEGNDLSAALRRARRGIACGATDETLGALRATEARALLWLGDFGAAESLSAEAMGALRAGSDLWYVTVGDHVTAAGRVGHAGHIIAVANELIDAAESQGPSGAQVSAMARSASRLFLAGRYDEASVLLSRLPDDLGHFAQMDPAVVGYVLSARANRHLCDGDPGSYLALSEESAHFFEIAGDYRSASITRINVGFAYSELGDYRAAEEVLRGVLEVAERMEIQSITALAQNNLGNVLAQLGQLDEAWDLELIAIESFTSQGDERLACGSRVYLSQIHELKGHYEAAEREAREAVARTANISTVRMQALGQLASALIMQGRFHEALDAAEEAMDIHTGVGQVEEGEAMVRLVLAEAYGACDRNHEARATASEAYRRLSERAEKIRDPHWRACFTENVEVNRRTRELAERWGLLG